MINARVRPNAPLRLAYVTETFPPEVNGVAHSCARTVQYLREHDHQVQLVRPCQERDAPSQTGTQWLVPGIKVPFYSGLQCGWPRTQELRKAWEQNRPQVVHVATEGPLGWSAVRAARALKISITSDFRTNFHQYAQHYGVGLIEPLVFRYLRTFHNRTHRTFVPTPMLRAELTASGFNSVRVVGRGVDAQVFSRKHRSAALRACWGADQESPVLLYVGRVAAEKNVQLAIDTYDALRRQFPQARMVIVGDGPRRAALQARYPLITFWGERCHAELAACYASADIFLFPSLTDTFGNVVLEAMASGLAVVAFDQGAAGAHLRSGISGMLVDPLHPERFVDATRALLSTPLLVPFFGYQAGVKAMQLSWDRVLSGFEAELRELIYRAPVLTLQHAFDRWDDMHEASH